MGRPNVSEMMTATSMPRAGPDAVADAAGGAVGVLGQQGGPAGVDVGEVDAGVGAHEAVPGLADHQVASPAQDPHRLRPPHGHGPRVGRGRSATRRPSALDTTFWVTTTTSPSASAVAGSAAAAATMMPARSSPGRISPMPVDAEAPRGGSPLSTHGDQGGPGQGGSRLGVVHDRRRHHRPHAGRLRLAGQGGVGLVDDERARQRRVEPGDAHRR